MAAAVEVSRPDRGSRRCGQTSVPGGYPMLFVGFQGAFFRAHFSGYFSGRNFSGVWGGAAQPAWYLNVLPFALLDEVCGPE